MILNMQVSYFGSVGVCVTRIILSAVSCASNGQWDDVWEVVKDNKGIILGVFVPLGLVLRWPAAVFAVARVGLVAAEGVISMLIMRGQVSVAVRWLWSQLVNHALTKKRRGKSSRK
jgi:hypothetical protein